MAERGLTAPTWPKEYGGGGLDKEQAKVLLATVTEEKLQGQKQKLVAELDGTSKK